MAGGEDVEDCEHHWADVAMNDIVGDCADMRVDEVADHAGVEERKEEDKPPPVELTDRDKKYANQHGGKKVFEADDSFHECAKLHVASIA